MITWNRTRTGFEGLDNNNHLIYWTREFIREIRCTVYRETDPKSNSPIAVFKEKKGTRKPLL